MNTTLENHTTATTSGTKRARRRTAPTLAPVSTEQAEDLLTKRPNSEITRLVFMALLGCAACLAMVGVVSQSNIDSTSPDAPAPGVIVEFAD